MTAAQASSTSELTELSFTVTGRISRPVEEVYEAVADPAGLSQYFTTGGAVGRLESGTSVQWDFADFPGAFRVEVRESSTPQRIVLSWDGESAQDESGMTTVTFTFTPLDGNTRTLVSITESSWQPTREGAQNAFGNCMGWTGMLAAMKAWMEHGINLRDGFYV